MPEGLEAPEPDLPPDGDDGEGRPGELRPELPEEPLEPDEPPDEPLDDDGEPGGDGMEVEDWLAQPPMRNADIVPTAVTCAATTSTRFNRS